MAVLQMKRISVAALKKDRKAILELLQRRGVVETDSVLKEDRIFSRTDTTASRSTFQKSIAQAVSALEILDKYSPEEKSMFAALEGRTVKSKADYDAFAPRCSEVMDAVYQITALARSVAEDKAEISKLEGQLDALKPWLGLDLSMRFTGTGRTSGFVGTLPGDMNLEAIMEKLAAQDPLLPAVHVDVISSSPNQTCILAVCHKDHKTQVEEALRSIGYAQAANPTKQAPVDHKEKLEAQVAQIEEKIRNAEKNILTYADWRADIQFAIDYFTMRSEKYEVLGGLVQSKHAFVLTGYVVAKEADGIKAELENRFDLSVDITDCKPKDHPPVALSNNAFNAPVEGVLASYGLPAKGEIDPCTIMAAFYYVLFGLMLSDAAYGILMVLGCGFCLLKFRNMESGMKKTLQMFFYCGISTTFWGFLFGSFFGDLVGVVANTFFGRPDIVLGPIWFEPVKEPMRMLVFSMLMGIIHLFTGLALKAYQYAKQKAWLDILYDVVFWYMLLVGIIVFGLSTQMFVEILQLNFILPSVVGIVGLVFAAIGAVGIVLTGGRSSKNPFKRVLKGAYELYGVTSYLSDILSYSRLLALGLATGVIATVINSMGSMMGGGIFGAIVFILVFLVGHTLNMAINLLGAYVHTNRLQFVEFFGKFYEGGGRAFQPFAAHTKYYNIKEETYHG